MQQGEKKLTVIHQSCILCGRCVMQGFALKKDGKVEIKADLSQEQWPLAEVCCPVGAICTINSEELTVKN